MQPILYAHLRFSLGIIRHLICLLGWGARQRTNTHVICRTDVFIQVPEVSFAILGGRLWRQRDHDWPLEIQQPAPAACSTLSTELIKQFEKRQRENETLIPNVSFGEQMLSALPNLRAFALSLVHDPVRADDLVQETILRAWSKAHLFEPGMNLRSWLFTILRHQFCSDLRKRKFEIDDPNGFYAARLRACPDQHAHLEWQEFQTALAKLTPDQRAALILVAAEGLSHKDAATVCGVRAGTIKSRVSRARTRLAELLRINDHTEIGPDNLTKAALQGT